jgi:hypothetical protein
MIDKYIEKGFDEYSEWRKRLHSSITDYGTWLADQKFSDIHLDQRIEAIATTLSDDKLYVAFVAEFSRGKSELINALFFGDMGQRMVPSSAGRTTMCPTELYYDPDREPAIQLLPIETRMQSTTIAEYKENLEEWETIYLQPDDPEQIQASLQQLTKVKLVSREIVQKLALHVSDDQAHEDGMQIREDGSVEIPRWRHALVNYPHPMLEQGLVILDTPGLNALGSEPELTLNMLSSAHAVLFILAADAGVTKSDLTLWRDHINGGQATSNTGRFVVLNKVDVLWDELKDPHQVEREIQRQIKGTSETLCIPEHQIFPISAQKGLLGKIKNNFELLESSGVIKLENAIANLLIPAKREIVSANVSGELGDIVSMTRAMNDQRIQDVDEHISELQKLNGKNIEVIEDMMQKVRADKEHLEKNLQRFQATRSIFSQQTNKLYGYLSMKNLDRLIAETKKDMAISLTTSGLRNTMMKFFKEITETMDSASKQTVEIQELMEGVYKKFQEEHGLANIKPRRFSINKYQREIKRLIERHEHFIRGLSMVITEQMVLGRRFYDSAVSSVRRVFQRANRDSDDWLKTIMSPMESQVREHQVQLRRRLESIKRIHKASDTLEDRLAELEHVQDGIKRQRANMDELITKVEKVLNENKQSDEITEQSA